MRLIFLLSKLFFMGTFIHRSNLTGQMTPYANDFDVGAEFQLKFQGF